MGMENPVKRDPKKIVWWGLICVLVFAAAQKNIPALWILHRRGLAAQGTVTDKEPYHNQRIHYTYSVDDRIYSGPDMAAAATLFLKIFPTATRSASSMILHIRSVLSWGSPTSILCSGL